MSLIIRPFTIAREVNPVSLAVTTTSQTVAVPRAGVGTQTARIVVNGTAVIYFKLVINSTDVVTNTTGLQMLPSTVETFNIPNDVQYIAFIADATGSTVQVSIGESA